ncbi:hypothetical protein [Streptomyces pseudovenezuelae]|uniref:Uncharacterized protein n=1 Tax=Streptomyces pseudovenezuelae TaxID=67350 RepID=A0ABT6LC03_9ACTN|nr:hypothetical protein [Streptomyces pseudovenezuelae]MDH6213830.1 hypothetical protein [Streptomyces pseudovenezuelae]
MPQDVTFDLPFDMPVSRHLESAQERQPCRGRECFLIDTAEAAMRVLVLQQE